MKRGAVAVLVGMILAGCGAPRTEPAESAKPSFGGISSTTPDATDLARVKAEAGIEDCPKTRAPKTKTTKPKTDGLPGLVLDCLGGGPPVHLAGLPGEPTVINLWASWCGPCKKELPHFAKADRELGDRVQILGIDFADDEPDAALELAKRAGVAYPLLFDPKSSVKADLKVVGLPQTVFVDAQGTIVATERRAYRSYDDLTSAISKHLGVKP